MAQFLQRTYTAAQLRQQEDAIQQRITHLEAERQLIRAQYEQQLRAELCRNLVRFVMNEARVSMLVAEESLMAADKNVELAIQLARSVVTASTLQLTEHPVQPPRPVQEHALPRPASPPLPAGWTQHIDALYNHPYYCNTLTGASVWERPSPA